MITENNSKTFTMPAGKYYIGDPCYALEETEYEKIIENFENQEKPFEINGHTIFMHNTSYGDGSYKDAQNRSYGVDSGLISIMPMDLVSMEKFNGTQFQEFRASYAHMIEFEKEFDVFYEDGKFVFGTIEIDTSVHDDEEEDNEEIDPDPNYEDDVAF